MFGVSRLNLSETQFSFSVSDQEEDGRKKKLNKKDRRQLTGEKGKIILTIGRPIKR